MDDPTERFPLHLAAMEGDLAWINHELMQNRPINEFDEFGYAPLHWAVLNGHEDAASLLIAAGADVNAHDERVIGNTPLNDAADGCTLRMARLLVDAGADPAIPGWMQLTALYRASNRKDQDGPAVRELLEKAVPLSRSGGAR